MLLQDQTTASRIEPSLNRRNSDFSPQNARKDGAWENKKEQKQLNVKMCHVQFRNGSLLFFFGGGGEGGEQF